MKFQGRFKGVALATLISLHTAPSLAEEAAPPVEAPLDISTQPKYIAPVQPALPDYGPAPKPAAATKITDPKARKAARKQREADYLACRAKTNETPFLPLMMKINTKRIYTPQDQVTPRAAISSCDTALASPVDDDDVWDRRALLLQSRASHLIALGAHDAALQSLEEADAVGGGDMLFAGSTGLGNRMLRAFAFGQQGKRMEALAEIKRGRAVRPHAVSIDRSFDRIEYHLENSADHMLDSGAAKIKWQPDLMRVLLPLYLWRGNLVAAGKFADDVSTVNPKPIGGWTISGAQSAGKQLEDDIDLQMQRAYVWAGLGDAAKSQAIIAAARADVTEFVGTKPVAEPRKKVPKYKMDEFEARVRDGEYVAMLITRWEGAIQMRADAATKPAEELFKRAEELNIASLTASLDILRQLKFSNALDQKDMADLIRTTDAEIARDILKLDAQGLRTILPEPEYLSQVPRFSNAGDGILFGRENGISQAKEKDSDIRTVRFGTTSGSGPMADELSLLAIAQFAQKEVKDSFILLARRSIKRTTTVSGYYTPNYTYDSGYESQARVVLLDSNNLGAEWADKPGRLIMVRQVLDEIKPRYDALEARKNTAKSKK